MLYNHILKIRKKQIFQNAKIIIIPESNSINEAVNIRDRFKEKYNDLQGVLFYHSAFDKTKKINTNNTNQIISIEPGSKTDKKTRPIMVTNILNILQNKGIIFYKYFIVADPNASNLKDVKEEIINQFSTFSKETVLPPPNDPEKRAKVRYYGKIKEGNDDFVMAVIINIYCAGKFMIEPQYKFERTY